MSLHKVRVNNGPIWKKNATPSSVNLTYPYLSNHFGDEHAHTDQWMDTIFPLLKLYTVHKNML